MAWDGLYDRKAGKWRIEEAIRADRDFFGRLDYLHIFDFGESRIYGRVGDYCHYDELGGREGMAAAIAKARQLGVPVGLYIEGYLCDSRAAWGRENVLANDIRTPDGKSLLFPGTTSEHMMCPASEKWRDHLARTFQRVAGELQPSGMYIDEFGFMDTWKTCSSRAWACRARTARRRRANDPGGDPDGRSCPDRDADRGDTQRCELAVPGWRIGLFGGTGQ